MGFTPAQMKEMSVYESTAAIHGWLKAHDTGGGTGLSQAEADEIWEWMQTKPSVTVN